MGLLQPATSTTAYLKMGLLGLSGSGKTFTAGLIACGLYKYIQARGIEPKPIAMFDTETGSDWLIPHFEKASVPFLTIKRRAFADLLKVMDEAEATASVLIIDSVTHPWRELCESYMKKKERTFLQMNDYQYLNGPYGWGQFNARFVNSKLHIIMCGRGGDIFEEWTDEDGKRHLDKVGTKMKTQTETAFEPSLLVLMQHIEDMRTHVLAHRAVVQKDRSTLLDGKAFDNPTFESFLPHIARLNIGGAHLGIQEAGDSQAILKTEKRDWQPVQRRIVVDEIQSLLVYHIPGQAAADKKQKIELLRTHFAASWTEIEEVMPLPDLRAGYDSLHRALENKPSRYSAPQLPQAVQLRGGGPGQTVDIADSLPDHSAAPRAAELPMDRPGELSLPAERAVTVEDAGPNGTLITLGDATASVAAKAGKKRTATTEPEGIPPFLRREANSVPPWQGMIGQAWGTD